MRPYRIGALLSLLLAGGAPSAVVAQLSDDSIAGPDQIDDEPAWVVTARPTIWFPSLSGNARFGPASENTTFNLNGGLGLNDNEASFNAEAWFTWDRLNLRLDVFDFDTESMTTLNGAITVNGQAISAGVPIQSDFGVTSVGGQVGVDLLGNLLAKRGAVETDDVAEFRAMLLAGVRGVGFEHRLAAAGGPTAEYDQWIPLGEVGARLAFEIDPEWELPGVWDIGVTGLFGYGGFDDVDMSTIDLLFNIAYMPTENLGIVFGYRQFDFDLEDDSSDGAFELDTGRLAGLYVGASIAF